MIDWVVLWTFVPAVLAVLAASTGNSLGALAHGTGAGVCQRDDICRAGPAVGNNGKGLSHGA